jgi:hypothetical protein
MATKRFNNINSLINTLEKAKYETKKISSTKVAVLTNDNRTDVLEEISKQLGGTFDKKPTSESSIGKVIVENYSILAKPANRQGTSSAGVENEVYVVDQINNMIKNSDGVLDGLIFQAKRKTFKISNVVSADRVGADTANRKKADFIVNTKNKTIPFSLKKDDAEMWESADSYYGEKAKEKVDKLALEKKIELKKIPNSGDVMTIDPNVAIKATEQEKKEVIFGSDLLGKGAVLTRTFTKSDFNMKGGVLTINVSTIIEDLNDVPDDYEPYFLIRNDKTRKSPSLYPGLRVLAVYKTRINKNVLVVK